MAKLTINRGSLANDGTGDNLREGANKINLNFDEIYTAIGDGSTVDGTIKIADDSSTVLTVSANGETVRVLGGTGITSTLSGNTLTIAADTSSLITADGTATLTNKTINGPDNTLTNIANSSLSNSSISITGDDSSAQTISLGGGILFTGGSGITTSVSGNEITFATDGSIVTETSTDTLTNKTINGPDNTLTNIANGSLANSSITLGDDSISLGGTQTTVTNLSLDGATGTIDLTSSGNKIRFNFATDGDFPTASTYEGMYAWDVADSLPYVADDGGWVKILTENASVGDLSNVNISGVADDYILAWSSAQGRFNVEPQKINAAVEIDVSNSGSSAYLFNSHYSGNNPTLYLEGGKTYALNLSVSGHPFHLQTVSGAYSSGNAYTTGLTHHAADGTVTTGASALLKESGTLYIDVPSGSDTTIYYACQNHSSMAGSIILQDDTASNASAGFAIAMSVAL